ncbi:MAG: hypothetical protein WCL06_01125 [Bacteroidota bacterium]
MSINQHNYELFILDHYEGKLDTDATRELMLYLDLNPEAKEAFESYETIMLTPDLRQRFEPKSSLKKTVIVAVGELNEENYEDYFIESVENNLSIKEIAKLNEFLSANPHLKKSLETYKKTILKPDLSVVFGDKDSLKKTLITPKRPTPVRRMVLVSVSIAAMLILILLSGIVVRNMNYVSKNTSFAFATVDINRHNRKTILVEKQNTGSTIPQSRNLYNNIANSKTINFADINLSTNKNTLVKVQIKKETQIETKRNNDLTANAFLSKRSEYSGLIEEKEFLLSRRNKLKNNSQDEGLANYIVKGIKNAARSTSKNKEDIADNKKIGFWDVAGFGVFAYNKITNNNLVLDKKTDANGRLMSFNIEDKNAPSEEKK